jgi:large subunit ribosomal protein L10
VRNHGITVEQANDLRKQVAESSSDSSYTVVKNTLSKIALSGCEKFSVASEVISGPCALALSNDPVSLAKVLVAFAEKNNRFQVVGGVLDENLLSSGDVENLSKMPSLDELRATIVMAIKAPSSKIVRSLKSSPSKVYNVLKNYSEKDSN